MASVTFTNLRNFQKADSNYTYSDLHLDIKDVSIKTTPTGQSIKGRDLLADYDVNAIINSLVNIFNTRKGERFLIPPFGCNLENYLFEPMTENTAKKIGNEIVEAIETWEPRVSINVVSVVGDPDNHQYDVTISLVINFIKQSVTVAGIIDIDNSLILQDLQRVCER